MTLKGEGVLAKLRRLSAVLHAGVGRRVSAYLDNIRRHFVNDCDLNCAPSAHSSNHESGIHRSSRLGNSFVNIDDISAPSGNSVKSNPSEGRNERPLSDTAGQSTGETYRRVKRMSAGGFYDQEILEMDKMGRLIFRHF